ncbi:MAG: hypothetical protein HQL07_18875 [Nitrospirae bacterium]|nr:hypothetical protein [Magnetococcales bacterium]
MSIYLSPLWKRILWTIPFLLAVTMAEAAPPPDHPSVDQANSMLGVSQQPPGNQGNVLETFEANNYSYIRVSHPTEGERWLAAPRLELAVGNSIRYGDGSRMENFFSKVWKRTFPVIYFVNEVVLEKTP